MRLLSYSLIAMLLIATIGLGWFIDVIYQHNEAPEQDVHQVKLFEQLGENLALTLQSVASRQLFIDNWRGNHDYQLIQVNLDQLAMPATLVKQIEQQHKLLLTNDSQLHFYYLLDGKDVMVLSAPVAYFQQGKQGTRVFYTLLFYGLLIATFVLWAYPLLRQLNRLKQASDRFGRGELSQRIPIEKTSYIAAIEQEFNHMAQRIEDLVADVKLLSSAVSHDLRTPLARIRFGLDTLAEEDDESLRQEYQARISANVDEMTELVEALLNFARLDQAMIQINRQPLPLVPLINKSFSVQQADKVKFTLLMDDDALAILGDENYINILLNNLLKNAINYGNGEVRVELTTQANGVQICVHDNGAGISAKQRAQIFKPFVRGNHRQVKGYGIGLAIVKRIVDWHQGTITVADSPHLSGAIFCVTLPAILS